LAKLAYFVNAPWGASSIGWISLLVKTLKMLKIGPGLKILSEAAAYLSGAPLG
jgi:hypothetical protein